MNAVSSRDIYIAAGIGLDRPSVILGQLRQFVPLAQDVGAVFKLVSNVLGMRGPAEMVRVNAQLFSAAMRNFMLRWRRPMDQLAHKPMDAANSPAVPDLPIAIALHRERPKAASLGSAVFHGGVEESARCAVWGSISHAQNVFRPARNVQRTSVGLLVRLFVPIGATGTPSVPLLADRGLPSKALNPIASNVRSVAQPGSASGLGKVALGAIHLGFSTPSHVDRLSPWHFPWDFLSSARPKPL